MRRAVLDPRLSVRVIDVRVLRYDTPGLAGEDRPDDTQLPAQLYEVELVGPW